MTYAFTRTENLLLLTLEGVRKVEGSARGNGNKAIYTAALVADGWAGAENLEKRLCDRPMTWPIPAQFLAYN